MSAGEHRIITTTQYYYYHGLHVVQFTLVGITGRLVCAVSKNVAYLLPMDSFVRSTQPAHAPVLGTDIIALELLRNPVIPSSTIYTGK